VKNLSLPSARKRWTGCWASEASPSAVGGAPPPWNMAWASARELTWAPRGADHALGAPSPGHLQAEGRTAPLRAPYAGHLQAWNMAKAPPAFGMGQEHLHECLQPTHTSCAQEHLHGRRC